jgi:hypothetical protein
MHRRQSSFNFRRAAAGTVLAGILLAGGAGMATAEPAPPTNGGNGAGSSGQCTGPASERPTACASPGGVSER